jgi:hypothetical protein
MGDGQSNSGRARLKRDAIPNNPKIRKQLRKIESDKKEGMTFAKRKAIRDAKKPKRPTTEFGKEGMVLKAEKKAGLYKLNAVDPRRCRSWHLTSAASAALSSSPRAASAARLGPA